MMKAVIRVTRHSVDLTTGEKTEHKLEGEELREWIDKNLKAKTKTDEKEQET